MSTELVQLEEGGLGTSFGQSNSNLIRPVDTEGGRGVATAFMGNLTEFFYTWAP